MTALSSKGAIGVYDLKNRLSAAVVAIHALGDRVRRGPKEKSARELIDGGRRR